MEIPEGWTAHDGSACPVPDNARVNVMFRDGMMRTNAREACSWHWPHTCHDDGHIIAYQVVI